MIACEPAQRTVESRPVEREHVRSRAFEQWPEARGATRAEPVVDQPDIDARARFLGERFGEFAPDHIVVDDVILEQDRMLGTTDGGEPGWKIFLGILQQPDGVAVDRQRARGAGKRAVGEARIGRNVNAGGNPQMPAPETPFVRRGAALRYRDFHDLPEPVEIRLDACQSWASTARNAMAIAVAHGEAGGDGSSCRRILSGSTRGESVLREG